MKTKRFRSAVFAAICALIAMSVSAADYYWVGGNSGSWSDANWATEADGTGAAVTLTNADTVHFSSAVSMSGEATVASVDTSNTITLSSGKLTVSEQSSKITVSAGAELVYSGITSTVWTKPGFSGTAENPAKLTIADGTKITPSANVSIGSANATITIEGDETEVVGTAYSDLGDGITLNIKGGTYGTSANHMNIPNGSGTARINLSGGVFKTGSNLNLGRQGTAAGYLTISGGSLQPGDTIRLGSQGTSKGYIEVASGAGISNSRDVLIGGESSVDHVGAEGGFTVSGGAWTQTAGSVYVGNWGTGKLEVSSGSYSQTGGNIYIGNESTGNGTITISGGTFIYSSGQYLPVGNNGKGTIEVTAGEFRQTSGNTQMGQSGGSEGVISVSGTGKAYFNYLSIGRNGGTAEVTLSGDGTIEAAGSEIIICNSAAHQDKSNILNLNGGTLKAQSIKTNANSDDNATAFNWNGGVFEPSAAGDILPSNFLKVDIKSGGAFVDTKIGDCTISHTLSGEGGLTKLGANSLTVSGAVALSSLAVSNGTLNVTGVVASSAENPLGAVTIARGAALDLGLNTVYAEHLYRGTSDMKAGEYSFGGGKVIVTVGGAAEDIVIEDDATITLDADADWSEVKAMVGDNATIDLAGHDIVVSDITVGTGVTIKNTSETGATLMLDMVSDANVLSGVTMSGNVKLLIKGNAVELPATVCPAGGIEFRDTVGTQYLRRSNVVYGLVFGGGAAITEDNRSSPDDTWQNSGTYRDAAFPVTVAGEGNTFTYINGNWGTQLNGFNAAQWAGDGELTIKWENDDARSRQYFFKRGVATGGFSGTLNIYTAKRVHADQNNSENAFYANNTSMLDQAMTNATINLCNDESDVFKHWQLLDNNNASTAPQHVYGNLATGGTHPENVWLACCYKDGCAASILKVGAKGGDCEFAGMITNCYYTAKDTLTTKDWNIEKHGTGTWTLGQAVANGGAFTVKGGEVDFNGGVAICSALTVESGAAVLLKGDVKASSVSLASGSTLKLDTSNQTEFTASELNLTGVSVIVSGLTAQQVKSGVELLKVHGPISGVKSATFDFGEIEGLDNSLVSFRAANNGDGTWSLKCGKRSGMMIIFK